MSHRYELRWGTWMWLYQDRILSATDDLTFCYDPDTFTMLKHGDRRDMEKWSDEATKMGLSINLLIVSKKTPEKEVNKIINTSGYIRHFIRNHSEVSLPVNVYA